MMWREASGESARAMEARHIDVTSKRQQPSEIVQICISQASIGIRVFHLVVTVTIQYGSPAIWRRLEEESR